ncbi:Rap1a/Tai family immunity protein [Parasphingorhabdus sp.]|uniref:Rap1a/Tai family immunity protein n=1 Tax=Parasphingorhabdus sp. TaxID=2709688 RepID=UPI003593131A
MTIFRFNLLSMFMAVGLMNAATAAGAEQSPAGPGAFISGGELLQYCSIPASTGAERNFDEFCVAYIMGVVDLHHLSAIPTGKQKNFCLNEGVEIEGLAKYVKDWIGANSEQRNLPASFLIVLALKDNFPCK